MTLKLQNIDQKFLPEDLDFQVLNDLLNTLDYVRAEKVSREEFNDLKWDFLVEDGEDKFWKKYILKLPSDLSKIELWYIIDFLTKKFNLQNFANIDKLINETKLAVVVLLRQDLWEEKLEEIKKRYNISEDFIEKIENQKISFWEKREFVNKIKGKRTKNFENDDSKKSKKIWENHEDLENIELEIDKLYRQEFDLTFFRKWVNLLRYWMETITQIEIEQRKNDLENNWYKKGIKYWKIYYTKWDDRISFLDKEQDIDKKEQKLRDKIWIEKLKQKLGTARIELDQEEINKLEIQAANKILKTIREFPYTYTEKEYWYQANKIAEYKEIHCVWFALLGHAFLSELWIKHNWLDIPNHSALEVIIWWKKYYFDGTYSDEIVKYKYKWKVWAYNKTNLDTTPPLLVNPWNPEKILLSHILNNKWVSLYELWKNKLSTLYKYAYKKIKWETSFFEFLYRKEKIQINNFVEKKDFEGLRKYLLELEKKIN